MCDCWESSATVYVWGKDVTEVEGLEGQARLFFGMHVKLGSGGVSRWRRKGGFTADPKHPMLVELVAKCKSGEITSKEMVTKLGAGKIDRTGPPQWVC